MSESVSNARASLDSVPPVVSGELLAGKYLVDRVVGRGAMGLVVAATHLELEQRVAIKLLLPELAKNDVAVARFIREARSAAQLKSEHVARVLDVGRTPSGTPYMVMEHLEGSDLAAVLQQRGPLPVGEAVSYLVQVCEAVAEAHAKGIVHRDLKPQNLFLTKRLGGEPLVKVLDFGISKSIDGALSALTQTCGMVGSPLYMAPEQLRGSKNVDRRSDIWSLGVVLQELVTGRLPFEAESVPELTLSIADDPARSAQLDRPEIPDALVAILARCLAKDPEHRFADVGQLEEALLPLGLPAPSCGSGAVSVLRFAARQNAVTLSTSNAASLPTSAARVSTRDETPRRALVRFALAAATIIAVIGSVVMVRARSRPPRSLEVPVTVAAAAPAQETAIRPDPTVVPTATAPAATATESVAAVSFVPARPSPARPKLRQAPIKPPPADDGIPSMR